MSNISNKNEDITSSLFREEIDLNISRQIIMTGSVPFSLAVPKLPTRDGLTEGQFNTMMEKGYNQAMSGEGLSIDDVFAEIREGI